MKAIEEKTAQLRVKRNCIIAEGDAGTVFWTTPSRARLLINGGGAELVNVGPSEVPVVGPSETKPAGPSEVKKNYSQDGQAGPSTGSAPSIESGKRPLSSSSVEGLVLPERSVPPLVKRGRGRPRKSG